MKKKNFFERYFYIEHLKALILLYSDESESPAIWAEMDAIQLRPKTIMYLTLTICIHYFLLSKCVQNEDQSELKIR